MKPGLRRVHRWLAFSLGLLWLSQALTGLLMVYRRELDDAPAAIILGAGVLLTFESSLEGWLGVADAPAPTAFLSILYPIHTGEALGAAGRVLTLLVGVWLLGMIVLGFGLWLARRR